MATWTSWRRSLIVLVSTISLVAFCTPARAQFGGFAIGGPNGVVIGGGEGLRIGGSDGVQFGGGQGAKFGGPSGVQFGAGQGARFGGPDGVQFGGGAGAKFGPVQIGGQPNNEPVYVTDARGRSSSAVAPSFVRPITLTYPADAEQPLDFTLNDWEFTIRPGETVNLRSDQLWIIQFAAGPQGAGRRYSLPPGHYRFNRAAKGWDLVRTKHAPPALEPIPAPPTPAETSRAIPRQKIMNVMR